MLTSKHQLKNIKLKIKNINNIKIFLIKHNSEVSFLHCLAGPFIKIYDPTWPFKLNNYPPLIYLI